MGLDATKPLDAPEMKFKRIAVPGQDALDVAELLDPGADWHKALT